VQELTLAELDARIGEAAAGLPAVLQEGRKLYNHRSEGCRSNKARRAALKRQAEAAASGAPSAKAAKANAKAAAGTRRAAAAGAAAASATAEACSAEPADPQAGSWSFFAHSRRACLAALLGAGVSLPSPAGDMQAFLEKLWALTSGGDTGEAVDAAEATLARWENRDTGSAPDDCGVTSVA
jgi:hypothetical protein